MVVKRGLCRQGIGEEWRKMQMRVMRHIEGVTRLDKIRNVDLRDRLKQERSVRFGGGKAAEKEAEVRGDG